jgi:hypothetical protein
VRFTRHRGRFRADIDQVEVQVLDQLAAELLEIVEEPYVDEDPLAALVGMSGEEVHPPEDPVLARLLPDAYRDDPAAAGDFRRFTDGELRQRKRANAHAVRRSLPDGGGRLELDRDQADQWLECLNDMRLALGTAMGVTEETDFDDFREDDPRGYLYAVYSWLGYAQESLLQAVMR